MPDLAGTALDSPAPAAATAPVAPAPATAWVAPVAPVAPVALAAATAPAAPVAGIAPAAPAIPALADPAEGLRRDWMAPFPLDPRLVLGVHRHGGGDPACRVDQAGAVWRASLTPDGPGTLRVQAGPADGGTRVAARAWGPARPGCSTGCPPCSARKTRPRACGPRTP